MSIMGLENRPRHWSNQRPSALQANVNVVDLEGQAAMGIAWGLAIYDKLILFARVQNHGIGFLLATTRLRTIEKRASRGSVFWSTSAG